MQNTGKRLCRKHLKFMNKTRKKIKQIVFLTGKERKGKERKGKERKGKERKAYFECLRYL